MLLLFTGVDEGLGGGGLKSAKAPVKGGEWKSLFEGDKLNVGDEALRTGVDLSGAKASLVAAEVEVEAAAAVDGIAGGRG